MKLIGTFEAKTHLSKYLDQVEHHQEEIIIQRHGKSIAKIIPFPESSTSINERRNQVLKGLQKIREESKSINTETILEWAKAGRR